MTGGLHLHPKSQPEPRMLRHTFYLDDGRELRFVDGRKFGKLWLAADPDEVLPVLGPDPLGDEFTAETLARSLDGRSAPVKALLLDQSIAAGIGNLYADESLFLADIHPLRPASDLSGDEIARLRDGIVAALSAAVALYDKSRAGGRPDPPTELNAWTIPRKAGDPCPHCGRPIDAIRVRGRGTCFCAGCQR
jgi:formamidopyrimidine-DNA glycosylase